MIIVRIGILNTNNEIPKHKVTIPRIEIQRVVVSIIDIHTHPYQMYWIPS
jgi:hypothetical protein